ncbi:unnamed protein product [Peniophora sp. CBMAI 1063]|nr:unnamed protein product [Peniophora sp. CBMAI 1063]
MASLASSSSTEGTQNWSCPEGQRALANILRRETATKWPDGPRSWQVEATGSVLDRVHQLILAGCGEGKTSAMYLHLRVHKALAQDPTLPRFGLRRVARPVALTVTPLTDLGRSQVHEATEMGLRAVALDKQTVDAYVALGRDLMKEVQSCEFDLVFVSPERLSTPRFDKIMRDDDFVKSLVLYTVDEAHVVGPWSEDFREHYGDIDRMRARMPRDVPVLLMSATLDRESEVKLVRQLNLGEGQYRTIYRPIDRPNVRTVFETLEHGVKGPEYPELAWTVNRPDLKILIYCTSYDICTNVQFYLQELLPLGPERKDRVLVYNALTADRGTQAVGPDGSIPLDPAIVAFMNDPNAHILIATLKCGMGVHLLADIVINLGLPTTAAGVMQQTGRAGRDGRVALGITFVEKSFVGAVRRMDEAAAKRAEEERAAAMAGDTAKVKRQTKGSAKVVKARGKAAKAAARKTAADADENDDDVEAAIKGRMANVQLQSLVRCLGNDLCLVAQLNSIFSRVPEGHADVSPCIPAKRRFLCSACLRRLSPTDPCLTDHDEFRNIIFGRAVAVKTKAAKASGHGLPHTPSLAPTATGRANANASAMPSKALTKEQQNLAQPILNAYCYRFCRTHDAFKHTSRPAPSFLPLPVREALNQHMLSISRREDLDAIMAGWRYSSQENLEGLFAAVRTCHVEFKELEEKKKKAKAERSAAKELESMGMATQTAPPMADTNSPVVTNTLNTADTRPRTAKKRKSDMGAAIGIPVESENNPLLLTPSRRGRRDTPHSTPSRTPRRTDHGATPSTADSRTSGGSRRKRRYRSQSHSPCRDR